MTFRLIKYIIPLFILLHVCLKGMAQVEEPDEDQENEEVLSQDENQAEIPEEDQPEDTTVNRNSIEGAARYEYWAQGFPDRYFLYLQYGRRIREHQIFLRLNSVWRAGEQGLQYEADFYPKFSPKSYGYFNIGYSNSSLLPRFKTAAEVFRSLKRGWEVSLGIRTVHIPDYNIFSVTGIVGRYFGNWYVYGRPTINFLKDDINMNFLAEARLYSGDGKSYIGMMALYGTDVGVTRDFNAIENTFGLESYLIRFKALVNVTDNTDVSGGVDFSGYNIPSVGGYVPVVGIDVTIRRRF
jgi:YaiO family outer membrane protein